MFKHIERRNTNKRNRKPLFNPLRRNPEPTQIKKSRKAKYI